MKPPSIAFFCLCLFFLSLAWSCTQTSKSVPTIESSVLAINQLPTTTIPPAPKTVEWLFIYYMPYDNDLSEYGALIIDSIQKGIQSEAVAAVVQFDAYGNTGINRLIITHDTILKMSIATEISATTQTFKAYLEWTNTLFTTSKSAVVLLDHGGQLDEICLDETPEYKLLRIDSIAQVLAAHNATQQKLVNLLFLQVCTKGTIEAFYEFKETAHYTLASQTVLGAPNAYYVPLFNALSQNPTLNGLEVARLIRQHEASNMFDSYTCVDNAQFAEFSLNFDTFFQQLKMQKVLSLNQSPLPLHYAGESYWDLVDFLKNLVLENANTNTLRQKNMDFIQNKLIAFHHLNPVKSSMHNYAGCSIGALSTNHKNAAERYQHLQFYQDFPWDELTIYDN